MTPASFAILTLAAFFLVTHVVEFVMSHAVHLAEDCGKDFQPMDSESPSITA